MTRRLTSSEISAKARSRRQFALERVELRFKSAPRVSAAGPTSLALKVVDPETRRLIEEFDAKQRARSGILSP